MQTNSTPSTISSIQWSETIPAVGKYDVIVAGGGISGVAAALSAARLGKSTLLLEKNTALGGLATIGLINFWVPLCNGRGKQIIKGMAEELLRLSIRYGFDSLSDEWKNGEPDHPTTNRYVTRYSIGMFALALVDLLHSSGVKILYDSVVSQPVMEDGHCKGLIVDGKSGRQFYEAGMVVDATGDADVLLRAEYICRFIEAYQQAGVDVKMLSSQNEPKAVQTWDSCLMNAAQEREFIQHHLYPALKRHHLEDVCLLIWDHNKERVFDRVSETLNNPEVAEMVGGAAVHWYSGDHFEALQMTHERFPKLQLVFSEGCVEFSRFGGTHQVRDAEMYAHDVIGSMNHGLNAFIDWNLLLDGKGGPNHVGNFCSAPAMYDEETGELRYNLSFDYLGHFSHYIRPGAVRIGMSRFGEALETLAVRNPDGTIVVVVLNRRDEDAKFFLRKNGRVVETMQEAHSISTYVMDADE